MDTDFKTYTQNPASGGAPRQVIVLLHGLGANGQDLIGLARYWEAVLPDAVFASPDAPFPCDMAPVGYQWFSLQDREPERILSGVQTAAPLLDGYLDGLLDRYGLEDKDLALVGFSQGTMMSLYVGPRRRKRIAGILGYSGALIGEETLGESHINKMPVCLIHGDADPVVPVGAYFHARNILHSKGFEVSGHVTEGLEHGIDNAGIETGAAFLSGLFA
ncbi:MAG: phospholipase [Rhodospirillales bacterium]|nr:phospholipase [Alphaproteobacteria bacterium]USO03010.1 MAG: phospholipase [Rhodospirillales bacterium]